MQAKALLAVLLAATTLVAGCLSDDDAKDPDPDGTSAFPPASSLSQPQYAILPPEEVWVTASDELRIHNAVYRPDTTEPVPVFVNFSPYWGDTAMTEGDAFSQYMIHEYVPRGYAVVLTAVRGTGHSEGCFVIGGDRELQDLTNVVDYFAQQPWSNGNLAAGGKSYDATSQNGMVAKFPHPALKGMFHVSGITDMYRYTMHDGVPYGNGARTIQFTPTYYLTQGLDEYLGATSGSGGVGDEDAESIGRAVDDAACIEAAGHVTDPVASAATGLKTAYWQERDYTAFLPTSDWNGSIFFVHGLQDWNVQPDHIQPWLDAVQAKGDIEVLSWLHQWQQGGTGHVYPMRADWNETMLRWLDHVLKGKATGIELLGGYQSQATDELWRVSAAWPPVPGEARPLVADGACAGVCEVTVAKAESVALRLAGSPVVHVGFTADGADPIVTGVLYKVDAKGERTWVGEGTKRGIYRDTLTAPSTVTPAASYAIDFALYPLDTVIAPGESLVLVLGGSTQQGTSTPLSLLGAFGLGVESVTYDLDGATFTASILPASLGLLAQQPEPMDCFTC